MNTAQIRTDVLCALNSCVATPKAETVLSVERSLFSSSHGSFNEYCDSIQLLIRMISLNVDISQVRTQDDLILMCSRTDNEEHHRHTRYDEYMNEFNTLLGDKTLLTCQYCKQKGSVSWEAKQTRSADEGQTIFCQCSACGKRWKF